MPRPRLGRVLDFKGKDQHYPIEEGIWHLREDDLLLYALLCDPVYCAEILGEDPGNREYGGTFAVRDYQYPLFRTDVNSAGFTCARAVGKTESIKWRSMTHIFRRIRQNLLLTAPELIHLHPLTEAIEALIRGIRLTREFLDDRHGRTGFTHRPFGADFLDGTKIVGRIPRLSGTGVKGQHQPDLIMDEAQDYPQKGWNEIQPTVMTETVDAEGNPDWSFLFYGVHSGDRQSGFHDRATKGGFKVVQITALQRENWNRHEKQMSKAAYGGTSSPDYKRNILGEPGDASTAFFITARLFACIDQDRDSPYNSIEVRPRDSQDEPYQLIRTEDYDEMGMPIAELLDLPSGYKHVYGGMDIGLRDSPTVITLFSHEKVGAKTRLKLIRRIHLERMRSRVIREAVYAIDNHFGDALKGFGIDSTGLGLPMWQDMQDDEAAPPHLMEVSRGYFFNAKVPVAVEQENVREDGKGRKRDQFGSAVVEETDPMTGSVRYVTTMPMIEASTRYLREMIDTGLFLLPFDPELVQDMQNETHQRVQRVAGLKTKPQALHILDSMRAMAMVFHAEEIEEQLEYEVQVPVLDMAL